MTSSRSSANARLVKKHQRQQSSSQARSSSSKFTQKQSHFERRREEDQVRRVQQASGSSLSLADNRTAGDGLLSKRSQGWGSHEAANELENPSPFAMHKHSTRAAPLASTRSAMMGLSSGAGHSTRSTRRADRFNLSSAPAAPADMPAQGGALGVRRGRDNGIPSDGLDGQEGQDRPVKLTRAEKFREMLASSKSSRAAAQRERADREDETKKLDQDINALLHLLPKRNKDEEERDAFMKSGTPEVRALLASYKQNHVAKCLSLKSSGDFTVHTLDEELRAKHGHTAASSGGTDTASKGEEKNAGKEKKPNVLDEATSRLLQKVRSGAAQSAEEVEATEGLSRQAALDATTTLPPAEDEFDAMMNSFRLDTRRAHAVPRTLSEEEQAALDAQQALLQADRQQIPSLGLQERDLTQLTRGELLEQGGEKAFRMEEHDGDGAGGEDRYSDEDELDLPSSMEGDSDAEDGVSVDEGAAADGDDEEEERGGAEDPTAPPTRPESTEKLGSAALDRLLQALDTLAAPAEAAFAAAKSGTSSPPASSRPRSATEETAVLHETMQALHRYAQSHVMEVAQVFRLVLIEAERSFLRGQRGALRPSLLLSLYAISKLFPMSDYRHQVTTPYLLFLSSTLLQMKLDSLAAVHSYLVLASLLVGSLQAGFGKFAAEAVVAPLNVLALQLPRRILEPSRYQGTALPVPLVERCEASLLQSSSSSSASSSAAAQLHILETQHDAEQLCLVAYRLMSEVCQMYKTSPAFPVLCAEPLLALDGLLLSSTTAWAPSKAVRTAHEELCVHVRDWAAGVEAHRTPLAMRTFRPRPLRLFDPLLAEREENAARNEVRAVKKEIREDRKRVIRHLTAEASVQRRAQEKTATVEGAQREKRYRQLMGELERQQHTMNTVESLKSRAKAKMKKGLSGAPKEGGNVDPDE